MSWSVRCLKIWKELTVELLLLSGCALVNEIHSDNAWGVYMYIAHVPQDPPGRARKRGKRVVCTTLSCC